MDTSIESVSKIKIHAPRDKVWEAITRPEIVEKYFFGTQMKADWREGGEIVYSGEWEGKPYEDRGVIKGYEEGYSVTMDFPGKYGKVTYTLIDLTEPRILDLSIHDHTTLVSITRTGMESEQERKESEENWTEVLKGMKSVLE